MSPAAAGPARRHLFEFEDHRWFPALFRNAITDWLASSFAGVYEPVVPLVRRLLEQDGSDQVIDLCSGGSGPWEYLKPAIDATAAQSGSGSVSVTLTDRYPNIRAFAAAADRIGAGVGFSSSLVDARDVPDDLKGVRTLFTSFHHLKPADATAVLADAARAGRSIGVFEFTRRDWSVIRGVLTQVPLSMMRSYRTWAPHRRWQQALVPLIVAASVWDAVVSQLRAYRPEELAAMTAGLGGPGYVWETGEISSPGSTDPITYVIGHPVTPAP